MLDPIPGMKLIMLDTCNSGAIVGKGLSPVLHNSLPLPFRRADYMVLTSAGGTELSWAFSDERRERALRLGNSYFAAALAFGLGLQGTYAADIQQDGVITLDEIYQYLLQNHASSTVQVYPQQSDYPVFTYNPKAARTAAPPVISGTVFSDELVTLQNPTVDFSFTVHSAVRLRYQLVYWRSGQWDWAAAQWLRDTYETPQGLPIDQGWVSPGRKQRALELSGVGEQSAGYAMVQIIALRDTGPQVCASKLIALMPLNGDPRMRIEPLPEGFVPLPGTELAVQVSHAFPLRLTARVLDAYGKPVRRLANNQLTHPIPISPEGSLFYWNGCDDAGQLCPPGLYTLDVSARVGDTRYHAQADLQLMAP
ncbi:MAG: hypothetical protein LBU67_03730, partial [Oscillospiraceae bacterium]|jgi:hypothetical protein|nr:hypothetical protein [Oscillospiraceae bacterium]